MDSAEHLVELFLKERFTTVVFEPDGNVPPDFLADGAVAVEVRRLNQNEKSTGRERGLEESSIPIYMGMRALLETVPPPRADCGFWVSFSYRRPLARWKDVREWVEAQLAYVAHDATQDAYVFWLGTFKLDVRAGADNYPGRFVLASYVDHDAGGWILAEMQRNIMHCVAEKTAKCSHVRSKYPTWWLVLVDLIGYGLNEFDQQIFHDNIKIEHDWDRVILVDPKDHRRVMEV